MNRSSLLLAPVAMVLTLAACSENSPSVAQSGQLTVEGVAATGWALTRAQVTIQDWEGDTVFQGSTDDLGQYTAVLDKNGLEAPLTITVKKDSVELEALVAEVREQVRLRAHVNPLTDVMAKQVKSEFRERLRTMTRFELDSIMAQRTRALLGAEIQYADFATGENYRAAVQGRSDIQPSVEDMVLHALTERAREEQKNLREWLEEQQQEDACLLEKDEDFRAKVIGLSQEFGVPGDSLNSVLGENAESVRAKIEEQLAGLDECQRLAVKRLVEAMIRVELTLQANPEDAAALAEKEMLQQSIAQTLAALPPCSDKDAGTSGGKSSSAGSSSSSAAPAGPAR